MCICVFFVLCLVDLDLFPVLCARPSSRVLCVAAALTRVSVPPSCVSGTFRQRKGRTPAGGGAVCADVRGEDVFALSALSW